VKLDGSWQQERDGRPSFSGANYQHGDLVRIHIPSLFPRALGAKLEDHKTGLNSTRPFFPVGSRDYFKVYLIRLDHWSVATAEAALN
jgi:hypothetical protein